MCKVKARANDFLNHFLQGNNTLLSVNLNLSFCMTTLILEVNPWNTNSETGTHRINFMVCFTNKPKRMIRYFFHSKNGLGFLSSFILAQQTLFFFFHIPTENHLKEKKTQNQTNQPLPFYVTNGYGLNLRELKISASNVTTEAFQA